MLVCNILYNKSVLCEWPWSDLAECQTSGLWLGCGWTSSATQLEPASREENFAVIRVIIIIIIIIIVIVTWNNFQENLYDQVISADIIVQSDLY